MRKQPLENKKATLNHTYILNSFSRRKLPFHILKNILRQEIEKKKEVRKNKRKKRKKKRRKLEGQGLGKTQQPHSHLSTSVINIHLPTWGKFYILSQKCHS